MDKIPIVALCGFLGSGKTTLLRNWRDDMQLADAAWVVHDLSESGVDARLLSDEERHLDPGSLTGRVAALHGSHAGESLHRSLGVALGEIAELEPKPSYLMCESTGAARPWPLIKALTQDSRYVLRHFIVTVDALNLHRDFANGDVLLGGGDPLKDLSLQRAAAVLAEQVAMASVLVLTKVDTIPKEVLDRQVRNLQQMQPYATVALSAQAGLSLSHLEQVPAPSLLALSERAKQLGLDHAEEAIASDLEAVVLSGRRPFHPERLHSVCQNQLGTGLYRTKGLIWLVSRPGHALLWQQAGSQISLELSGLWRAEIASSDEKLLPEEREHLEALLESEDPVFGDRRYELTVIGSEPDRSAFLEALEWALCSDEEVTAWKAGESFADPWPTIKEA
ncbi:CobW family GTP-binding protein [Rubritalea marina]|uniref:CobW family GTP-binding protein n=1 Tax=Rubritalea marina TaxID=361055 RepID=UPI00039A4E07|nr:GTP-binding protein [Rubritalea marina]